MVAVKRHRIEISEMRKPLVFLAVLFACTFANLPSKADGVMNAVAYKELPSGLQLDIQPFDDSDANLEIEAAMRNNLEAKGVKTSDSAPYILSFEVRDRLGSLSTAGSRHVLRLESRGGRGGGEQHKARVNVYDSHHGGLFNKGVGDSRVSKRSIYRLEVNISERASGKRIWDGWAEADLTGGDSQDLTLKMVPTVIEQIGKTIRQAPFKLY